MNNYLEHHGIKGMKWGVRRSPEQLGRRSAALSKNKGRVISDFADKALTKATHLNKEERAQVRAVKQERKHQAARRSLMSDDELNSFYNRMNKEKLVREVSSQELSRGRTAAQKALGGWGKQAAGIVIGAAAGYAGQQIVKNYLQKS